MAKKGPSKSRSSRGILLDPLSRDQFFTQYWENEPLHIARNQPEYFTELLSLSQIEAVLSCQEIHFPDAQVTQSGRPIASSLYTDDNHRIIPGRLLEQHAAGATIVMSRAHTRIPTLAAFCRQLTAEFRLRCQANIYLSPAASQGFNPHFDSHDVFILQVSGSKTFNFYAAGKLLPVADEKFDSSRHQAGVKTEEILLQAGDTLYIPRGVMHDAVAATSIPSLHITLGVFAVSQQDLLSAQLQLAASRNSELRRSLPWDLWSGERQVTTDDVQRLRQWMIDSLTDATLAQGLSDLQDEIALTSSADCSGMLTGLGQNSELSPDSILTLSENVATQMEFDGAEIKLRGNGQIMEFNGAMAGAIKRLIEARSVSIGQWSGLDEMQQMALARQLLSAGMVKRRR